MVELPATRVREAIMDLVAERGAGKSICPSEAARRLVAHNWRPLMASVRREAIALAADGSVIIMQKGQAVDPRQLRGPYRIARAEP